MATGGGRQADSLEKEEQVEDWAACGSTYGSSVVRAGLGVEACLEKSEIGYPPAWSSGTV